jgi:membrane-bound ClpP family serine protease
MRSGTVLSVISTVLEEAAIAAVFLWVFPRVNVRVPIWILPVVMVAWAAYSLLTFRLTRRALQREDLIGLANMVGSTGEVICPLAPEGVIRIRGELWAAVSEAGEVETGEKATVVGQDRLKLVVRPAGSRDPRR